MTSPSADATDPRPVPDTASAPWPDQRYAWYVVTVLMVAYTLSYLDRQILSLLVGPIRADLGISDTAMGALQGLGFAVTFVLAGIPLGMWADRGTRHKIIAAGIAFWSLMTAACGIARSFWQLFAARVGVGVGEAALAPAAYSMIADYVPPERRGKAIGLFAVGVYLGIGLSTLAGGLVIQQLSAIGDVTLPLVGTLRPWQLTFVLIGLPGLVIALWTLTLREPVRRGVAAGTEAVKLTATISFLRANARTFGAHFLGYSLLTLLFNALAFWMPEYFIRTFGWQRGEVAVSLGPVQAVFGALGIFSGGLVADALRRRGRGDAEMRAGVYGAIALLPFALLTTQMSTPQAALVVFAGFMFFSSFPFAAAAAALQLVTPNRMRGQVSALWLFCVNLTGIGLGSLTTGVVTDYVFGDDARLGDSMTLVAAIAAPLAALVLGAGLASYRKMQTA
jgi:MFS family permease